MTKTMKITNKMTKKGDDDDNDDESQDDDILPPQKPTLQNSNSIRNTRPQKLLALNTTLSKQM